MPKLAPFVLSTRSTGSNNSAQSRVEVKCWSAKYIQICTSVRAYDDFRNSVESRGLLINVSDRNRRRQVSRLDTFVLHTHTIAHMA